MLTHHTPELTNQISGIHMRPRSAESARKPKYKISDFKSRGATAPGRSNLNNNSEFSIMLPPSSHGSLHGGGGGVVILNLEERPEAESAQRTLSLGPTVVTDDEYSGAHELEKAASSSSAAVVGGGKHQRYSRLKRGHRRTASTGSNILPPSTASSSSSTNASSSSSSKDKEPAGQKNSNPFPSTGKVLSHPLQIIGGGVASSSGVRGTRPGSADSSRRRDGIHTRQESCGGGVVSTAADQITKTAHEVSQYMHGLIDNHAHHHDHAHSRRLHGDKTKMAATCATKDGKESIESSSTGKDAPGGGGVRGVARQSSGGAVAPGAKSSGGGSAKGKGRFMDPAGNNRNKPGNKSTDSNETTSSEGNGFSSKGSSQSDSSAGGALPLGQDSKRSVGDLNPQGTGVGGGVTVVGGALSYHHHKADPVDLSRTESMSSTCSTVSIYGTSTLPSRNHSFIYDGGESSTYSHESLEIGDSVENLQVREREGWGGGLI